MQLRSRSMKRLAADAPTKTVVKRRIVEEAPKNSTKVNKKRKNGSKKDEIAEDKNAIESLPLEMENGDGKVENTNFTEDQLKRKVQCQTQEGKIIEVPWCLMMQSQIFSEMWTNLGQEEKVAAKEKNAEVAKEDDQPPFIFQLRTISTKSLHRIVDWMRHKHGQPEFELKLGQETGQQIWFQPDQWEFNYGFGCGSQAMDLEEVKELYSAANYLDLKSLYHYCVQECALHVIRQKKLEDVRDILGIGDDMTDEEKAQIRLEFALPNPDSARRTTLSYTTMRRRTFGLWMDIDFDVWQYGRKRRELAQAAAAPGPATFKDEREKKAVVERKPIPPELIRPILAKLSLADQRWLLTLNWNVHRFLAPRVKENLSNWKQTFDAFIVEQIPNDWYHGQNVAHVRHLRPENRAFDHWTPQRLLVEGALQTEMRVIVGFVQHNIDWLEAQMGKNEKINERNRKDFNEERRTRKADSTRAKDRMDNLIEAEAEFLKHLTIIFNRYTPMISMNPFSRGLFHLIEHRRQALAELVSNSVRDLDKKLAEMEATDKKVELAVNEYWIGRL